MKRVDFTEEELQALAQLLDAGIRQLGLNSVKNAAALLIKLENAEDVEAHNSNN